MIYVELKEGKIIKQNNKPFDEIFGEGLKEEKLKLKGYLVNFIPRVPNGYKLKVVDDGIETKLEVVKDEAQELEIYQRLNILESSVNELCHFYNLEVNLLRESKDIKNRITALEDAVIELTLQGGGLSDSVYS